MNRTKRISLVAGSLTILAAVFFHCQLENYSQQKTAAKTEALLNQLPDSSLIAVSVRWKNTVALRTVSFPNLATATETNIRTTLIAQGVTHLLLTNRDVYPHLSIYSDSVSLVETDAGCVTLRYASQSPLSHTAVLKGADTQLCSIYLGVDRIPIHFGNNLHEKIKIRSVVCEFLGEDEILRLPPKEIYLKDEQFLTVGHTCPYTVFIHGTSDNPFEWTPICIQSDLRNSLAIKFYLLDEPSEFFTLVYSSRTKDEHIKIWELK